MVKIVTVLGARPQFVKAAVLSRIILENDALDEVIIHTGQHFDNNMSEVFFDEMSIPKAKYNLNINGLSHGAMTGQMLEKIEEILVLEKPEAVVVYGDTNSTLAGALAAKKLGIKVIHIEAGLRSFNNEMPEEINRILTDRISDLLLCPTDIAIQNLKKEGFDGLENRIVKSGDIMKDAVSFYSETADAKTSILSDLQIKSGAFVLATIHRQENTDDLTKLKPIFETLDKIAKDFEVVLPLHPRTRNILKDNDLEYGFKIIDPVGYFEMLTLLKHCKLVITDSGGLQKEAFFNKKHCIIVRDETEWLELVENDFAKIVGSNPDQIIKAFNYFSNKSTDFSIELYGNHVGLKIYDEIKQLLH